MAVNSEVNRNDRLFAKTIGMNVSEEKVMLGSMSFYCLVILGITFFSRKVYKRTIYLFITLFYRHYLQSNEN